VAKAISIQYKVHYIDITPGSQKAKEDPELIASDGLHPSAKEYKKWAQKVAKTIAQQLK
jgi:lysophospholipase L1-like esterase